MDGMVKNPCSVHSLPYQSFACKWLGAVMEALKLKNNTSNKAE